MWPVQNKELSSNLQVVSFIEINGSAVTWGLCGMGFWGVSSFSVYLGIVYSETFW